MNNTSYPEQLDLITGDHVAIVLMKPVGVNPCVLAESFGNAAGNRNTDVFDAEKRITKEVFTMLEIKVLSVLLSLSLAVGFCFSAKPGKWTGRLFPLTDP